MQGLIFLKNKLELMNKPLIIFDMDGTLIDAETVDEFAKRLGIYEKVKEITRQGMNGEITFSESINKRMDLLKGTDINLINQVIDSLPLMPGSVNLCNKLLENNFALGIITGGFDIAAEKIANKLGIHFYIANKLHFSKNKLESNLDLIVTDNKGELTKKILDELQPKFTIATGDGSTDIPMLKAADLGIAFCAKEKVRNEIKNQVNEKNLFYAFELIINYSTSKKK